MNRRNEKEISRTERVAMNGYFLSLIKLGTVNAMAIFRREREREVQNKGADPELRSESTEREKEGGGNKTRELVMSVSGEVGF